MSWCVYEIERDFTRRENSSIPVRRDKVCLSVPRLLLFVAFCSTKGLWPIMFVWVDALEVHKDGFKDDKRWYVQSEMVTHKEGYSFVVAVVSSHVKVYKSAIAYNF